jgi:predicted nuclease with TOPRIM domain
MARTVQIQGLKETCNQYLMNAKVQARKDSSSHLMKKLNELLKDMELITNEFFDSVTSRQKQIEKAPHPLLKQNLERDLEKDIIDFSNCKSSLIDNFKKIVNESV